MVIISMKWKILLWKISKNSASAMWQIGRIQFLRRMAFGVYAKVYHVL